MKYALARYSDIFGEEHWTHYCYRIQPGPEVKGEQLFKPRFCNTYNDSDADHKNTSTLPASDPS